MEIKKAVLGSVWLVIMVNSAECFVSLQGGRTRLKPATASDDNAADGKTGSASCLKDQPDTTLVALSTN